MNTQDIVASLVAARLAGENGVVVKADRPIPIGQVLELVEPIEYMGPIADFFDDGIDTVTDENYKPFRERWAPDTVPTLSPDMAFICELGAGGMDAGVWISVVNLNHNAPFRKFPHVVIEVLEDDHVPV